MTRNLGAGPTRWGAMGACFACDLSVKDLTWVGSTRKPLFRPLL